MGSQGMSSTPNKLESSLSKERHRKTEESNYLAMKGKLWYRHSFGCVSSLEELAGVCSTNGLLSCLEDLEGAMLWQDKAQSMVHLVSEYRL